MPTLVTIISHWKAALSAAAAVLVVLLQIIQLLLSSEIDTTLVQKSADLRAKTEAIDTLLNTHSEQTVGNSHSIAALHEQISALQREVKALEDARR